MLRLGNLFAAFFAVNWRASYRRGAPDGSRGGEAADDLRGSIQHQRFTAWRLEQAVHQRRPLALFQRDLTELVRRLLRLSDVHDEHLT